MDCDIDAVSGFLTDKNPDAAVAAHLCVCAGCRRLYERMKDTAELLGTSLPPTAGLTLLPEQWIYSAAIIGGEAFEGMPDVLRKVNAGTREAIYAKAQNALMDKGLIDISFDGTIGIKKHFFSIVDTCVSFDRFLSLVRRTPGKAERICNIYEKDGDSVIMYVDIKKGCTAVRRSGRVYFADTAGNDNTTHSEILSAEELRTLRDEVKGFGGVNSENETRELLKLAMQGSVEYHSITEIIKNPGRAAHFNSAVFINTHDNKIELLLR